MVEVVLKLEGDAYEASVREWFLEEGDAVEQGDDILELAMNKDVFRIAAPVSGTIAEVYYDEGETVEKGEVLCLIADAEEPLPGSGDDEELDDEEEDEEGESQSEEEPDPE